MKKTIKALLFFILSYCLQLISVPTVQAAEFMLKDNKQDDLEIIRKRVISDLLEPKINQVNIEELQNSIKEDGTWPSINYEDVSKTGFEHSQHLENMLQLCRAYKKEGTLFYQNPQLKKAIDSSFNFWTKNNFICENWWWNEMGTPRYFIDILLLMDDDFTKSQQVAGLNIAKRANLVGVGARPGGDLIPILGMIMKQGLFERNEKEIERTVKAIEQEVKISLDRGIKPDLSFHHRTDHVISILSYGTGFASSFAYWSSRLSKTKYEMSQPSIKLLTDYFLDGICKSMVYGQYPDPGAKNRGITRKGALEPEGITLPENLRKSSDYRSKELESVINVRLNITAPLLSSNSFFWHSEYLTHQRPNYFTSVRMHSDRNKNMEEPYNEEGLKNHHYADGSNFISPKGTEYLDIFPVFDWQKIPGTTIVQKPNLPHWNELAKKGLKSFVGGVSDGVYGAAAFDFQSPHDPLHARKSWFFFDKEFVCLGAGIQSDSEYPVYTTINQCLLSQDVIVNRNGQVGKVEKSVHQLGNTSWVLHDGVAYYFPSKANVNLSNTLATGNWRQINHHPWATDDVVQKEVFTLWFDHGIGPKNENYEYVVIPEMDAQKMDAYSTEKGIQVLSNTSELQAVKHATLNMSQLVFYKQGKINLNEATIEALSPCMLMVKTNGERIEQITVSDPTHNLDVLHFEIGAPLNGAGANWKATWDEKRKTSKVEVILPRDANAGKSVVIEFKG